MSGFKTKREAEIDEVILRQVPDERLLETLYTIEVYPADDERINADRRSTLKLAGQVNDEERQLESTTMWWSPSLAVRVSLSVRTMTSIERRLPGTGSLGVNSKLSCVLG